MMGIRTLLLVAFVISNVSWTTSRHHFRHHGNAHGSRHRRQDKGLYHPASYIIPGGVGTGPWGNWEEVSPCSRTCGGGVASQKRICIPVGPGLNCTGGDTKYFSCQTQDCPENAGDFRAEQCSEFDHHPYKNSKIRYTWIPYTKAPNPCELNCMPRGERFYYKQRAQVVDGTRCNEESFNVCVAGVCQPAGCDMMLGSMAREDKCRNCRGNGTNCHTLEGLLETNDLTKGYNDMLLIPQGATNILIEEVRPSNNYLALRGKANGEYYLNGKYEIVSPNSFMITGTLWHYERSSQGIAAPDKLRCMGPTREPLYLSLILQDYNVGIRYEYSVPSALALPLNEQYNWVHKSFSACSASCGGGFQVREVECRSREELNIVDDKLCGNELKPPTNQTCNIEDCPPRWVEGPWSPCSRACGDGGTRSRQVSCEKIITNRETFSFPSIVGDKECFDLLGPKPELYQRCNQNATCPTWFIGPWKPCNRLCGEGKETRLVVCHQRIDGFVQLFEDSECEGEKPITEKACLLHPCDGVDWVISEWSGCDTCLSTVRTRVAHCATKDHKVIDSNLCSYHPSPVLTERCDRTKLPSCQVQWYATQWSNCSVECGTGIRTRRVFCGLFDGASVIKVDDERCDEEYKYNESTECVVPKEKCAAKWFAGPWSECTKKCGGGEQSRRVMCLFSKEDLKCDNETILHSTQSCNIGPCNKDDLLPLDSKSPLVLDDYDEEDCIGEDDEYPEVGAEAYAPKSLTRFPEFIFDGDINTSTTDISNETGSGGTDDWIDMYEISTIDFTESAETTLTYSTDVESTTEPDLTISSDSDAIKSTDSTSKKTGKTKFAEFLFDGDTTSTTEISVETGSGFDETSTTDFTESTDTNETALTYSTDGSTDGTTVESSANYSTEPSTTKSDAAGTSGSTKITEKEESLTSSGSTDSTNDKSSTNYSTEPSTTKSDATATSESTKITEKEESLTSSGSTDSATAKSSTNYRTEPSTTKSDATGTSGSIKSTETGESSTFSERTDSTTDKSSTNYSTEPSTTKSDAPGTSGSTKTTETGESSTSSGSTDSTTAKSSTNYSTEPSTTKSDAVGTSGSTKITEKEESSTSSGNTDNTTAKSSTNYSTEPSTTKSDAAGTSGSTKITEKEDSSTSSGRTDSTTAKSSTNYSTEPSTTNSDAPGTSESTKITEKEESSTSSGSTDSTTAKSSTNYSTEPSTTNSDAPGTSGSTKITEKEESSTSSGSTDSTTAKSSTNYSTEQSTTKSDTAGTSGSTKITEKEESSTSSGRTDSTTAKSSTNYSTEPSTTNSDAPGTSESTKITEKEESLTSSGRTDSTTAKSSTNYSTDPSTLNSDAPGTSESTKITEKEESLTSSGSTDSTTAKSSTNYSTEPSTTNSDAPGTSGSTKITEKEESSTSSGNTDNTTAKSSTNYSTEPSTTKSDAAGTSGSTKITEKEESSTSSGRTDSTTAKSSTNYSTDPSTLNSDAPGTSESTKITEKEESLTSSGSTDSTTAKSSTNYSTEPSTTNSDAPGTSGSTKITEKEESSTSSGSTDSTTAKSSTNYSTEPSTTKSDAAGTSGSTKITEKEESSTSSGNTDNTTAKSSTNYSTEPSTTKSDAAGTSGSTKITEKEESSTSSGRTDSTTAKSSTNYLTESSTTKSDATGTSGSTKTTETGESSTSSGSTIAERSPHYSTDSSTTGSDKIGTSGSTETTKTTEISTSPGSTTAESSTHYTTESSTTGSDKTSTSGSTETTKTTESSTSPGSTIAESSPHYSTDSSTTGSDKIGTSGSTETTETTEISTSPGSTTTKSSTHYTTESSTTGSDKTSTSGSTETTKTTESSTSPGITTGESSTTYSTESSTTGSDETSSSGTTETTETVKSSTSPGDTDSTTAESSTNYSTESSTAGSDETSTSGSTEITETVESSTSSDITNASPSYEEPLTNKSSVTETTPYDWASTVEVLTNKPRCKPRKIAKCTKSKFGCCPDKRTPAAGPFDEGCPNPETCKDSKSGCCPDGVSPAAGPLGRGCPISPCNETLYGCCSDNLTAAEGNNQDGCPPLPPACKSSKYGCCDDNDTDAMGPEHQGCPEIEIFQETTEMSTPVVEEGCATSEFGCCFDDETNASGPNGEGCPCSISEFGCCPDGNTTASGNKMEGCLMYCNTSSYGCCPDGETPAHGSNFEGCCLQNEFGCCPDNYRLAKGPLNEGCGCEYARFGCCTDNITIARGPNMEGCGCEHSRYGCCPDRHTEAQGLEYIGCECHTYQFGCCPDGVTTASGPELEGCRCDRSKYGCCGDKTTSAKGPNMEGCDCSNSKYGCCPDGETEAKGDKFLNCSNVPVNRQAACALNHTQGTCHNYTALWFYDMEYGGCSQFWYGGCDGNANRFISREECEDVCVQPSPKDTCNLPKVKASCEGYNVRWYYNSEREQCSQFVYGGCLGNANNFDTKKICEERCEPEKTEDQCNLALERGPCAGHFVRWGFNVERRRCEQFVWGGCGGNHNRYDSEAACQLQCIPPGQPRQECSLPQDPGNCTEKHPVWSFNKTENRCVPFYYSGCGGNDNRFNSEHSCDDSCPSAYVQEICTLPAMSGDCADYTLKWFFDTTKKRCRQFYYGGCGGNENNFLSESECENRCSEQPTTTTVKPELLQPQTEPAVNLPRSEFCLLDIDKGPCTESLLNWAYDVASGACVQFQYGGCLGNRNNFPTLEYCERYCGPTSPPQDVCHLPFVSGPCDQSIMQWFYDTASNSCSNFTYGGCEGNGNRFNSLSDCEQQCHVQTPPPPTTTAPITTIIASEIALPTECQVSSELENCMESGEVWFLDVEQRACVALRNEGPGPRCRHTGVFHSQEACERTCGAFQDLDPCGQSLDPGNCNSYFIFWYYVSERDVCQQFVYGGCDGNDNRFETQAECESRCKKEVKTTFIPITSSSQHTITTTMAPSPDLTDLMAETECATPVSLAPCEVNVTAYYFDTRTKACLVGDFGACRYSNNYRTEEECERRCGAFKQLDVCGSRLDPGPCLYAIPKFYWDPLSGSCRSFAYGGCQGGPNRFSTADECEEICGTTGPESRCLAHVASGTPGCGTPSRRWYYSTVSGECEAFVYSGCGGNDNNFHTYKECARCKKLPSPVSEKETGNEVLPDCDYDNAECAALQCEYGVQRTRTSTGCETCICNDHPCANKQCSSGERCVATPYRDDNTLDILYSSDCRIANKSGSCPSNAVSTSSIERRCRHQCNDDADCHGVAKCCERGCSKLCLEPAVATSPAPIITTYVPEPQQEPSVNLATKPEVRARLGGTATLICLFHGNPPPKITWQRGLLMIEGDVGRYRLLSDGALEIVSLYRNDSGVYICIADNGLGIARQEVNLQVDETETGNEVLPDCDFNNSECAELQCEYGVQRTLTRTGCERCICNDHPCANKQCSSGQRCVATPYRDAITHDILYSPDCRLANKSGSCPSNAESVSLIERRCRHQCQDDADCLGVGKCCERGCSKLCLEPAVVTSPAPSVTPYVPGEQTFVTPLTSNAGRYRLLLDGSLEIVSVYRNNSVIYICIADNKLGISRQEVNLQVDETGNEVLPDCDFNNSECGELQCEYGVQITLTGTGCERCICNDHPCANKQCSSGERCVATPYRDDKTFDILYSSDCRITNKSGSCPSNAVSTSSIERRCRHQCNDDADCHGVAKCCERGCSKLCLEPAVATSPAPTVTTYVPEPQQEPSVNPATDTEVRASLGGKATLRCLFHGNPPPKITWKRRHFTIEGDVGRYRLLSDGALEIVSVYRNDSGVYICIADNGLGIARQEVNLQVGVPVATRIVSERTRVAAGSELSLLCEVDGYPIPEVYWTKDSAAISSDDRITVTETRLTVSRANTNDTGVYGCHAFNAYNSNYSSLQISVEGLYIPPTCKDNPFFANCPLIVRSKFCSHKYYSSFCCKSCVEAGQLDVRDLQLRADDTLYRK